MCQGYFHQVRQEHIDTCACIIRKSTTLERFTTQKSCQDSARYPTPVQMSSFIPIAPTKDVKMQLPYAGAPSPSCTLLLSLLQLLIESQWPSTHVFIPREAADAFLPKLTLLSETFFSFPTIANHVPNYSSKHIWADRNWVQERISIREKFFYCWAKCLVALQTSFQRLDQTKRHH